MNSRATSDIETASSWSLDMLGPGNPVEFFLAPRRFESARRTSDSLAITLQGRECYGMGFGPHVPVNSQWARCSIDQSSFGSRLDNLVEDDRWNFYAVDTSVAVDAPEVEVISDDAAITSFLREHAPTSSVWPGNDEIIDWFLVRDERGEWASLGALVRWESGRHVLVSVATANAARGRGFAQHLVRGIVGASRSRGISWLGLGVFHANAAAQRVYEHAGFVLRARFTNYALA